MSDEEEERVIHDLTKTASDDSSDDDDSSSGEEENLKKNENKKDEKNSDSDDDGAAAPSNKSKSSSSSSNDDDDSSSSSSDEENEAPATHVGGSERDEPAFALLSGVLETDPSHTVTVALTRLPATLGRSHGTKDSHFFGIGDLKAVSRQQCAIHYQNPFGGRLGQFKDDSDEFSYQPPPKKYSKASLHANGEDEPSSGYYVVECLGKNRIIVNGKKIEKGEFAVLRHGTPIRMNALCLYFLLPNDAPERTMEVPNPEASNKQTRKRKTDNDDGPSKKPAITKKKSGTGAVVAELETLSLATLMERMDEAIRSDVWERKHQMIGSAIALHAVKAAAQAKPIIDLAKEDENHGVARAEIMAWIKENPTFSEWVSQMNSRMEPKSYQTNINKALLKAGFVRTGTVGRHVKWVLPPTTSSA